MPVQLIFGARICQMYQIIAPTLFQNKTCRLPGIGTLVMVTNPAQTDFVNSTIYGPTETIDFIAEPDDDKGFNEFSAFSELLRRTLEEDGSFLLQGIGKFIKNETGTINFEPIGPDPVFTPPVPAVTVNRQTQAKHALLVGDQETTNVEMAEYYTAKAPSRNRWWLWAILLAAIGIGMIAVYFSNHSGGFGNMNPLNR